MKKKCTNCENMSYEEIRIRQLFDWFDNGKISCEEYLILIEILIKKEN